ncbi:MAG: rhodanese-like domain-containing protein [Pseudomonadota bacterium]
MSRPDQSEDTQAAPPRMSRRGMLVLGGALLATGGAIAAQWYNVLAENTDANLTPDAALQAARMGTILLVDIRRPDEWRTTGIGEGAVPIDMRRDDFQDALRAAGGDGPLPPVAFICARGVRSRRMTERLMSAGFTDIIDVPEGMLGSGAGPGWLRRGLPVVAYP